MTSKYYDLWQNYDRKQIFILSKILLEKDFGRNSETLVGIDHRRESSYYMWEEIPAVTEVHDGEPREDGVFGNSQDCGQWQKPSGLERKGWRCFWSYRQSQVRLCYQSSPEYTEEKFKALVNLVLRNQLLALIINELVPLWIAYLSEKHEVIKNGQPGWAKWKWLL